jgi:hypothetical protein
MYVPSTVLGERPFEPLIARIGEEGGQDATELAAATFRKGDRPIVFGPCRQIDLYLQEIDAPARV